MMIPAASLKIIIGAAVTVGAGIWAVAPGKSGVGQREPFFGRYFAHRGLHIDGSAPENSIAAFRRAAATGYGVELDVHITKDGEVVVFHDYELERMTGVQGRIEEWTYEQLQTLRLAGTAEKLPLLTEVLHTIAGACPIILEVKPSAGRWELCRKVEKILTAYPGNVCVECFDPRVLWWFRRHAPGRFRGQLAMPAAHYDKNMPRFLAFLLSRCLLNFLGRPQFIAYELGAKPFMVRLAEKLGAMRVCWTSRRQENGTDHDAVIFEGYRPDTYL